MRRARRVRHELPDAVLLSGAGDRSGGPQGRSAAAADSRCDQSPAALLCASARRTWRRGWGARRHLLELLYQLSQHFAFAEAARSELLQQQQRARRLGNLLEYLELLYDKRISVADAAGMASMSESRFMRYFRAATGMTFVSYLTHIRLHNAARLLRETDLNIGQVADAMRVQ